MEIHTFFLILLAMLLSARVLGELATRLGAPELLGGFAAGLALSRRFAVPMGVAIGTNPEFARRLAVGLAMVPRGEVGLIFAGGRAAEIFTPEV